MSQNTLTDSKGAVVFKKRLILYADAISGSKGELLREVVIEKFFQTHIEMLPRLESLIHRLNLPPERNFSSLYLLLAESFERLEQLHEIRALVDGKKVVLVIPDDRQMTYKLAFQMYPRYVSVIDVSYTTLCSVLFEMLRQK